MTKPREGASTPAREERDRKTGAGEPSPGGGDRGGAAAGEEPGPVDLDTAHDRAS
ncbi:MAG: hypothetical protein QOG72_1542 [Sphingomonadales bacterium]|jgi:hypothetical protein|nr:hypothetical protein [Sphingomonadales bacterium]